MTKSFKVTNTGGAAVDVKFGEKDSGFVLQNANGSTTTKAQVRERARRTAAAARRADTSFARMLTGKTGAAPAAAKPMAAPWTDIADYPATVMDNRVVSLEGKTYSIAGGNGSASTGNSYVYDPATLAWTAIAPLPGARNAISVGVIGGKIIASSGWGPAGPDAGDLVLRPGRQRLDRTGRQPGPAGRGRSGRRSTASCTPSAGAPPPAVCR